ncbi:hypothetical protein L1987_01224 [Smallanthus sonchifolius]|uniref:Uncharacterized protein n=1 Tax=Smallanthus sonchifolius TaxID=185202 RepID=A0ACB9K4G3_9ASTR|nr:hypothetical protein L1987_01224 [Smallanthus sonchifolius]
MASTIQKVEDNTVELSSDPDDSFGGVSDNKSEATNQEKQLIVEVYDSVPFSLNVGTQEREDDSSLSKPPGFGGQRFDDLETTCNQSSEERLVILIVIRRLKNLSFGKMGKFKFRWRSMTWF